jgi:hypothetical protein
MTPSDDAFLTALFTALGGMSGISASAAVILVVQILMKFLNTDWATTLFADVFKNDSGLAGWVQLLLVSGLTVVVGVLTLHYVSGVTWLAALLNSTTLAALQVFGNQIIQKILPAPATPPTA